MKHQSLFSEQTHSLDMAAVSQVFGLTRLPGLISFANGWPDSDLFPVADIQEITQHILTTEPARALQYGQMAGDDRLIRWLSQRMKNKYDMTCDESNIMITTSTQQGLYMVASLLINPDDTIITEAPTFFAAFGSMKSFRGNIVGVPMDNEGMDMAALEVVLKRERVKYVYTIPDFQNPSGRTMSLARRHQLIALAEQYDFIIVEDNPYTDLCFSGNALPTIYSLDPHQRTIFLGSFSKIFTPLRIGWLVGPSEMVKAMLPSKLALDANTPTLIQSLTYHYCQRGLLDGQIERLREAYGAKRDFMLETLERFFPKGVEWTTPDGGMFIWVTLPEEVDALAVLKRAVEHKVSFVAGYLFYPDAENVPKNEMRLSFVTLDREKTVAGIERLGAVLREFV